MFRFFWFALFSAPFVVFFHSEPLPTFVEELLSASLVVSLLIFSLFSARKNGLYSSQIYWIWLLWGGTLFISVLVNDYPLAYGWKVHSYVWILGGCIIFAATQFYAHADRGVAIQTAASGLLFGGVTAATLGLLQFYGVLSEFFYWVPSPQARFIGTFSQANLAGLFSLLALFSCLYLAGIKRVSLALSIVFVSFLSYSVVASGSRTAWGVAIIVVVLLLVCLIFWPKLQACKIDRFSVVLSLIAALIIVLLSFKIDRYVYDFLSDYVEIDRPFLGEVVEKRVGQGSANSRILIWKSSVDLVKEHWLFGVGPGNFGSEFYRNFAMQGEPSPANGYLSHAHNIFIMIGVELGILGLLVLLFSIGATLYHSRLNEITWDKVFVVSLLGCFFAFSFTEYPLWYFHLMAVFLAIVAFFFPVRKISNSVPSSALFLSLIFTGVFIGLSFIYGSAYKNLVAMVQGIGERHSGIDYVNLSMLEDDDFFGPYASTLKYQFFPFSSIRSDYDIERSEAMLKTRPTNVVAARYALVTFVNDGKGGCESLIKVVRFYPETVNYFNEFFDLKEYSELRTKYEACLSSSQNN